MIDMYLMTPGTIAYTLRTIRIVKEFHASYHGIPWVKVNDSASNQNNYS